MKRMYFRSTFISLWHKLLTHSNMLASLICTCMSVIHHAVKFLSHCFRSIRFDCVPYAPPPQPVSTPVCLFVRPYVRQTRRHVVVKLIGRHMKPWAVDSFSAKRRIVGNLTRRVWCSLGPMTSLTPRVQLGDDCVDDDRVRSPLDWWRRQVLPSCMDQRLRTRVSLRPRRCWRRFDGDCRLSDADVFRPSRVNTVIRTTEQGAWGEEEEEQGRSHCKRSVGQSVERQHSRRTRNGFARRRKLHSVTLA